MKLAPNQNYGTPEGKADRRRRILSRWSRLKLERSSWDDHWRDLNDWIQPRKARFLTGERNNGGKKNQNIINGTARRALRVTGAGMNSGITSPARPWFGLTMQDTALAALGSVKEWLHAVEEIMRAAIEKSNIYMNLPKVYVDLLLFGTSALHVERDEITDVRSYKFPIGQYALANSARGDVDTVYREFEMTVSQLVERFGLENCSENVQRRHNEGKLDEWVKVLHVIEPNPSYEEQRLGHRGKKFQSCWLELTRSEHDGFLREAGFEEFPVMAPRWDCDAEDVYGSSPGMDALGDVKSLQAMEKKKLQALAKIVDPPLKGPAEMNTKRISLVPGDFTAVSSNAPGNTIEPIITVHPSVIPAVNGEVRATELRINQAFLSDLWLMMADVSRGDKTAREIAELHEEKMLQLGPVLEGLHSELLRPLISIVFRILFESGKLPPPPPEVQGLDIKVEFTSILAQALKLLGISGDERLASFVLSLQAAKPDIVDKLDLDELVDDYAKRLGTNPKLVRPADAVAKVRQARAAEMAKQAQAEQVAQRAQAAKTMSETPMEGDTALSRVMATIGGSAPGVPTGV